MTVEERLARIEETLEKSGIGLLAQMGVGETLSESLGLLAEPKNLQLLSLLARFTGQADALEKLAETLEKLDRSGALAFLDHLAENFGEGLGLLTEPQTLRLASHGANLVDLLSRVEPVTVGMIGRSAAKALEKTLGPDVVKNPPRVGSFGLLKQLSDPEVQEALGLLFLFLKVLARTVRNVKEEMSALEAMMPKKA